MYFLVCKHSDGRGGLDIYMSIHFLRSKCGTCVLFLIMMMSMFPICCDRMYEMLMYVYFDVIYANLTPC
jgi:hypothetical protein